MNVKALHLVGVAFSYTDTYPDTYRYIQIHTDTYRITLNQKGRSEMNDHIRSEYWFISDKFYCDLTERAMYGILNAVALLQCQGLVNTIMFGYYYDNLKRKELAPFSWVSNTLLTT